MDLKSATPAQMGAELNSRDLDFILLISEAGSALHIRRPAGSRTRMSARCLLKFETLWVN